jgi:hypothetical protein
MLSDGLGLGLEGLSTLQRKLLLELLQRRHPQFWRRFTSQKYNWQSHKESLEEFLQSHSYGLAEELAKSSLSHNGWKTKRRRGKHVQS